ncbi:MAG: hypothetical protein WCS51_05600 [Bacilli bacterium]
MTLEEINKTLNTTYSSFEEFIVNTDWGYLSKYDELSEDFMRCFENYINWSIVSVYQHMSEDFIREFHDKIDWKNISEYQKLSEEFIREFQNKVNWGCISEYQKLSEKFIKEFKDNVEWNFISMYQKLSEDFIREFKDKVEWDWISEFQKLSEDFIKEFNLEIDNDNWLYKSTEFKKQQIVDCGLYECHDDYFIAYKAIRKDRYSWFNFQYQYLPNETYEAHCDCSKNEISFGLSVWTKKEATDYNNKGLIVKVKVNYEDVGRLVHDSNKIRCNKITILE